MHFSCKLRTFSLQFIHGDQTYDETITTIIFQAVEYTRLAVPTVEAGSTVELPFILKY